MKREIRFSLSNGFTVKDLLHYGIDHLNCAKHLFQQEPKAFDSAGYLTQLGMELIIKALLLNERKYFTDSHKLYEMYQDLGRLKKKWILPKKHEETLKMIDEFYELRYPRPGNPVGIGSEDWPEVEALYKALRRRFTKRIEKEMKSIDPFLKGDRTLTVKARK